MTSAKPKRWQLVRRLSMPSVAVIGVLIAALLIFRLPLQDFVIRQLFLPDTNRPAEYAVKTVRHAEMVTRDGTILRADLHLPVGLEKMPTIFSRIPFTGTFKNTSRADALARFWASRGYAVVVQGTRGRYRSDGEFYPAIHERHDGLDTIEWLKQQPWYDGNLAMWGGSAFGHTQLAVSDSEDIGAYALQIVSSSYERTFHPNGAFALESALYWGLVSPPEEDRLTTGEEIQSGAEGWPVVEADDRALQDVEFYNDWATNRAGSDYWKQIDGEDRMLAIKAPVLMLGGWFDPFVETMLQDFNDLRQSNPNEKARLSQLIVGPYTHAGTIDWPNPQALDEPYRRASVETVLPWFDYHFGLNTNEIDLAPLKLYIMGDNLWRDENEWPLARTVYTHLHFHADGNLSEMDPSGSSVLEYDYDPQSPVPTAGGAMLGPRSGMKEQLPVGARDDVLSFLTTPLPKPMEVTGPVQAKLWVTTDTTETDFTAKLLDVYPDGRSFNVVDGIIRQSFDPNRATAITIDLGPTAYVFGEGHKIRVDISSSNFPRFDRSPNTGEDPAYAIETKIARQKLHLSNDEPSGIILPMIPRAAD